MPAPRLGRTIGKTHSSISLVTSASSLRLPLSLFLLATSSSRSTSARGLTKSSWAVVAVGHGIEGLPRDRAREVVSSSSRSAYLGPGLCLERLSDGCESDAVGA
ncbi:hypothetical protein FA13DRAFT_846071 [Coprinellus micaceus]|uniref:Uncharacterized protein n=1 Tax=Coprinellus micaceus TaxID=71717 RepID=A0A4Y7T1E1_COPMI|nr:hypothetical protein FA13DRAFT_846071 [Coprinellus micaceus]